MKRIKPATIRWFLAGALLAGCSSSPPIVPIDAGGSSDAALPDDYVPVPKSEACTGEKTACLSGTVKLVDFKAAPTASRVTLYRVFPHGDTETIQWVPVALDGTFAFSDVPAWDHYYLEAEARFGTGTTANAITSVVGSFSVPGSPGVSPGVPGANAGIPLVIRPVFLEVLQQAASTPDGGAMPTVLAWASAHLFDPTTGAEVTEGSVTLAAGGEAAPVPMPYTSNAGGTKSFYAALPAGTMGGTSFAITTSYTELGASPVTWKLAGEPATFQGAITGPSSSVPANQPLPVTWVAVPMASYSVTELFVAQGSSFVSTYVSPVVNAPNVTTETIPASALGAPGSYLLNESYANATCPATADGCVYNVSTAAMNLTVN